MVRPDEGPTVETSILENPYVRKFNNCAEKTQIVLYYPHQRSITVSLETYPLYTSPGFYFTFHE